jgi:hypothetical protein
MTAVGVWLALLAAAWWWASAPAGRTVQDRRDLANVARAKSRRVLR